MQHGASSRGPALGIVTTVNTAERAASRREPLKRLRGLRLAPPQFRLQTTNPGFRTDNVLTLRTVLPTPKYDKTASRTTVYQRVLDEIRSLPQVTGAGYISFLPMVIHNPPLSASSVSVSQTLVIWALPTRTAVCS